MSQAPIHRRLSSLLIGVVSLGISFSVHAEPKNKLTKEERAAYIAAWKQANLDYKTQEYEKAVTNYKEAFRISADPDMLVYLGQSYRKAKKYEEALDAYRRFLEQAEASASVRRLEVETEFIPAIEALLKQGSIKVASDQEQTQIYLDGIVKGFAPLTITEVAPGDHTIKAVKKGFTDVEQTLTLNPNQAQVVNLKLISIYGALSIEADEKDPAELYIDGALVGTFPYQRDDLPVGIHQITIVKKNFRKFQQEVTITPGGTITIQPKLIPSTGTIKIASNIKGAEVLLNDKSAGFCDANGRLVLEEMPVGEYSVLVRKKPFQEAKQSFSLVEDARQVAGVELTGSPFPKAAYGVGGFLAAGGVTFGIVSLVQLKNANDKNNEDIFLDAPSAQGVEKLYEDAKRSGRNADILFGAAVVSAGVGYFLARREQKQEVKQAKPTKEKP